MSNIKVAVIMAGGAGERFWPLSRQNRPKQLLNLTSPDKCLIAEAIDRLPPLVPAEHTYIITGHHLVEPMKQAGLNLPEENILAEPCRRNTAACLAYTAAILAQRYAGKYDSITMGVLTADHKIEEPENFRATLKKAFATAHNNSTITTIGVKPTRVETGYGYIEQGDDIGDGMASVLKSFREKPDSETAEIYIEKGNFLWNSGMFFWDLDTFKNEFKQADKRYYDAMIAMEAAFKAGDNTEADRIFTELPGISIDYALMEKAQKASVVPAGFPWDDVGAWDAISRSYPGDEENNITVGEPVLIDCNDCIVYNEPGQEKVAVAAVGVEGLVIVNTKDGVLIVPKDRAQDVKQAVIALKENNSPHL